MSKKVAIVNTGAYGHVRPTLALTRALVGSGNSVDYLVPSSLSTVVEEAGARPFIHDTVLFDKPLQSMPPSDRIIAYARLSIVDKAIQMLPTLLAYCESEQPDILAFDRLCWTTRICARRFNIPSVMLHSTYCGTQIDPRFNIFAIPAEFEGRGVLEGRLAELLHKTPEAPRSVEEVFAEHAESNIVFMSRQFHPFGERFADGHHFVGASAPFAASKPRSKQPRLVYVSLGTVFGMRNRAFFSNCIAAFGGSEWEALISIGPGHSLSDFGQLPPNVRIFQHVDQIEVLSEASAFVTHGGMNSVQEAIWFEVPMVVVPQAVDQFVSAERIVELGCGVSFSPAGGEVVEALRSAVRLVTRSSEVAASLRRERDYSVASGGAVRAAELLLSLAK